MGYYEKSMGNDEKVWEIVGIWDIYGYKKVSWDMGMWWEYDGNMMGIWWEYDGHMMGISK